ncbi:alpha/beta hydrolase [Idiomarina sp. OXR-189]|uniref:alpha/beta hydrolase n=1 Tax=Idiomarina sp. OXR-189 TaxID=3100175 RepID=UPI000A7D8918|nr:alpha/beta fold hydrolase [Idiomarina sp. OXR-189]WPZ01429.1 alpha/beta fold hydrolase [Idiomarina sp. OXR-189]
MNFVRYMILLLGSLILTGCASIVSNYLQSADSFDYRSIGSSEQIAELGFTKREYCSANEDRCTHYFIGEPLTSRRLQYQTEISSARSTTAVELSITRDSLPVYAPSTIVLIHGFRASKEFMVNTALYFRFLGFNVIVPDLLGHGDSAGAKTFGVIDSYVINEIITKEHVSQRDLYLLGNSMGAVTATRIASMRDDVRGLILQSPMLNFSEAVYRYSNSNYPFLAGLIGDEAILEGASSALSEANLTASDTDIMPILSSLSIPLLILTSSADEVSPYASFAQLRGEQLTVKNLPNRNHPSMAVIGDKDSAIILDWLER